MSELAESKPDVDQSLVEISADIVCAYVSHNALSPEDVTKLISDVHTTLHTLKSDGNSAGKIDLKPAVSIKKSLTPDYIVCLEDGKKFKSLKRHIRTHYDLSPEEYREKWGLPANYPMVAPSYSKVRSRLARANGLGKKAGS
ncbi:MAG: MucR family transcriptional regulator [Devosiaceae bacterium]|nr:MucR family transcriptional regulator [Devosiaceae bacterium]